MSEALTSSLAASALAAPRLAAAPVAPPAAAAAAAEAAGNINLNAPTYVSPSISFDPYTNIVFITYRNPETGKVRNQIPPSEVVDRYREVEQTGIPNPDLPANTPLALAEVGQPKGAEPPDSGQGSGAPQDSGSKQGKIA